ncbi:flagellar biosynthesis protein FlhF [Ornithinibacillus gellani]|uniref:flagellar biosynthesis protein FlhF n=1 Tax=Ornithinibacillus gellani TaxID=2293253 RepID=UPI000F463952|nr:flagellar biosynthesis protein FlhF [Ornithinibacillus gellani]TQS75542.1 flagellar biosynthesis protein FlhF [Ornithinibacillus gellani]
MKVKKFIAQSMPEAMQSIRKEMGPDAVILQSKEILDGGFLGFFKQRKIEVIAGLDPNPIRRNERTPKQMKQPLKVDKITKQKTVSNMNQLEESPTSQEVLKEIREMKQYMQVVGLQGKSLFMDHFQTIYKHLLNQEVEAEQAFRLVAAAVEKADGKAESLTFDQTVTAVKTEILHQLSDIPFQGLSYTKKIVRFVGPTGVGKTTTIAKIAAKAQLTDGKKVALITMDTYRIAAVEQLKTYAKILNIPLEVVYASTDFNKALEKFSAYDFILVDTAGRNFRDAQYMDEVKELTELPFEMETYLVLSLSAKQQDLQAINRQFEDVPIYGFIFTKLDETRQFGSMLSLAFDRQIGISYVTAGQDVPEDIDVFSAEQLCGLLLEDVADE